MNTQMKACIVQMGIPVSCSETLELMKENIYSVLLGKPPKKSLYQTSKVVKKALFS